MSRRVGLRCMGGVGGSVQLRCPRLFYSYFKTGDASEWSLGHDEDIATGITYKGNYAERANNAPCAGDHYVRKDFSTARQIVDVQGFIRIDGFTSTTSAVKHLFLLTRGQIINSFEFFALGIRKVAGVNKFYLNYWKDLALTTADSGLTVTLQHWYKVHVYFVVDATIGEILLEIDDVEILHLENINTSAFGNLIDNFFFGTCSQDPNVAMNGNITAYFDEADVCE